MDNKTLIEILSKRIGWEKADVEAVLDSFSSVVKEKCCSSDIVAIPGFGSIETKKRLERISVNPSTGKRMLVPPKIVVSFKPSALLKQKLKSKNQ